jgi:hypothetical protein
MRVCRCPSGARVAHSARSHANTGDEFDTGLPEDPGSKAGILSVQKESLLSQSTISSLIFGRIKTELLGIMEL